MKGLWLHIVPRLTARRLWSEPLENLTVLLWYILGTLIWMPMLYFLGNVMWRPPTGALVGVNDTIFNWFYGYNVLGLWFTTGLLAVVYHIVPKETKTPLYSHFLSLIAFSGIVFFYAGVGAHHLLWAPIPYWLKTIAVAESMGYYLLLDLLRHLDIDIGPNYSTAETADHADIPIRQEDPLSSHVDDSSEPQSYSLDPADLPGNLDHIYDVQGV